MPERQIAHGFSRDCAYANPLVTDKLDIEGLSITVKSATPSKSGHATGSNGKRAGKGKARGEGAEILDNTTLRLKAGRRYALVGRNGSGKSSK